MKIAIIVGVSDYISSPIPAAKKDADLVELILSKSSKFDDILRINTTKSFNFKNEITQFVEKMKLNIIDEFIFYFSGHGKLIHDDLHLLMSDFDEKKPEQTSFSNSELDSLIKSLNPKLTIKIIDACHAGIQYVKDFNYQAAFEKAVSDRFENVYFMHSSNKDEKSFHDGSISDFTKAFGDSVINFEGENIRYKDICDSIADSFSDNYNQRPHFVIQASNTEIFMHVTPDVKSSIQNFFYGESSEMTKTKTNLLEKIASDAERYCNEEEVFNIIEKLPSYVSNFIFPDDIKDLYDITVSTNSEYSQEIPNINSIGKWLLENKHNYFTKIISTTEYYTVMEPVQDYNNLLGRIYGSMQSANIFGGGSPNVRTEKVEKTKKVPVGLEIIGKPPFCEVKISMNPRFKNIEAEILFLVFVYSDNEIRFFYNWYKFVRISFQNLHVPKITEWKTAKCDLRNSNDIERIIREMLSSFNDYLFSSLEQKFGESVKIGE